MYVAEYPQFELLAIAINGTFPLMGSNTVLYYTIVYMSKFINAFFIFYILHTIYCILL